MVVQFIFVPPYFFIKMLKNVYHLFVFIKKSLYIYNVKQKTIMIDKTIAEAILTTKSKNTTSLLYSLSILKEYSDIKFETDENGKVYYTVNLDEILNKNITEDDLYLIKDGGWVLKGNLLQKIL